MVFRTQERPRINVFELQRNLLGGRAAVAATSDDVSRPIPKPPPMSSPPVLQLPSKEHTGEWLRQLLLRDGPVVVARALLGACPRAQLMMLVKELCDAQYGLEPFYSQRTLDVDEVRPDIPAPNR